MLPPIKSCRECERNTNERFGFFFVFETTGQTLSTTFSEVNAEAKRNSQIPVFSEKVFERKLDPPTLGGRDLTKNVAVEIRG
jgi:hypothetical protein